MLKKETVLEYAGIIIWALLIAFFIRTFFVQAFTIPSGSMKPTLQIGDFLLVNKMAYSVKIPFINKTLLTLGEPKRGDMIVFEFPLDHSKDFIKRVIGVEGDIVQARDKKLLVNGKPIPNDTGVYVENNIIPASVSPRDHFGPIKVPKGSFFVMGDNRDQSMDSRFWGFVKNEEIKGRALILYWSWDSDAFHLRWQRLGTLLYNK